MTEPTISIIIPCLNEADYIGRLLDQLAAQTTQNFEVIVVDSKSSDDTVKIAKIRGHSLQLTVLQGPAGVANARNRGAAAARGDWLLFLDADVQIPSDFLVKLLAEVNRRQLTVATTNYQIDSRNFFDQLGLELTLIYQRALEHTEHPIAYGFCILIKKTFHHRFAGFDPKLKLGEDHYYVMQAIKAGANFGVVRKTKVTVSLRRYRDVGKLKMLIQNVRSEIYRFRHGFRIESDVFDYKFGRHEKTKD